MCFLNMALSILYEGHFEMISLAIVLLVRLLIRQKKKWLGNIEHKTSVFFVMCMDLIQHQNSIIQESLDR